jgi:hypothetical protein
MYGNRGKTGRLLINQSAALLLMTALPFTIATGCGSKSAGGQGDCATNCQAAQSCPGATMVDCNAFCSQNATLSAAAGCSSQYQGAEDCLSGLADICASISSGACSMEETAFEQCAMPYCQQNPGVCPGSSTQQVDPAAEQACNDACNQLADSTCLASCTSVCGNPNCTGQGIESASDFMSATSIVCGMQGIVNFLQTGASFGCQAM